MSLENETFWEKKGCIYMPFFFFVSVLLKGKMSEEIK